MRGLRSFVERNDSLLFALACGAFLVLVVVIVVADPLKKSNPPAAPTPVASTPAVTTPAASTPATTPTVTTPVVHSRPAVVPRVQVIDATLDRAHGTSGQQRNRARLTIRLTVTNSTTKPIFSAATPPPTITMGSSGALERDPATATLPETLRTDQPLPPKQRRTGTLRFELAGAQTDAVASSGADLRVSTGTPGTVITVHVAAPA